MGVSYNTRIVTDNLITHLDPANPRSYPGSGTTWFDLSGNGNHGTLSGPTYSAANQGTFSFDGVNNKVTFANKTFSTTNGVTVDIWFNTSSETKYQDIFDMEDSNGIWTTLNYSGYGIRRISASFNTNNSDIMFPIYEANKWYNLVMTGSGTTNRLYLNGVLVGTGSRTVPTSINFNNARIGNADGDRAAEYFVGSVGPLKVYNRQLSESEILQNYNAVKRRFTNIGEPETYRATTTINRSGLTLELDAANTSSYPGSGTTWYDISGSGTNFTLVNGPTFDSANGKGSINFAGDNDYAVGGSMPTGTNPFTLNMWVYLNSNIAGTFGGSIYAAVLASGSSVGAIEVLLFTQAYISAPPHRIILSRYGGGTTFTISDAPLNIPIQTWNNFTLVRDGSASEIFYLNGRKIGTLDVSNSFSSASIYLGGATENASYSGYLNGKIGCFHQYNRALSAAEVYSNFNALRGRYGI